jgi:hypothetical protein
MPSILKSSASTSLPQAGAIESQTDHAVATLAFGAKGFPRVVIKNLAVPGGDLKASLRRSVLVSHSNTF